MELGRISPQNKKKDTKKPLGMVSLFVLVALFFTFFGMIVTSNLDFTPKTIAQTPLNIAETGIYPVVARDGEIESPFVQVVERVSNAVVNISAKTVQTNTPWWHQGTGSTSSGSGFFFRKEGYILTNNHVVEHASELLVTTASGYQYEATLVGADPQTDLAVLKIEPKNEDITVIPFGESEDIKVGDWAIAIGNPFPQQGLERTVTVGVISAKGRRNLNFGSETPTYQDYIQTDASINPGNSGGPLLNIRGECIGVNSAISSPTGASVGIGFAIPISIARSVVPDLIELGKVNRGWLGVWLGQLTEKESRAQGIDGLHGVKIDSVFTDSPADRAGIKSGDIITRINGQEVENNRHLTVLISQAKGGQPIPVTYVRNGSVNDTKVIVADRETFMASLNNGSNQQQTPSDTRSVRWLGMELVSFTDELAALLNIEPLDGVFVQRVAPGSPASNSSISRGTVILQVNNEAVSSIDDILSVSEKIPSSAKRIPMIVVEPDGSVARIVIRP